MLLAWQDKTVIITALDSETGQPVSRAAVGGEIDPPPASSGVLSVTRPGRELGLIPHMPLTITAPGYRPADVAVFVPWWQTQQPFTIHLEPNRLTGQVVDKATGQPMPAAIFMGDTPTPQQTGADGHFELRRLEAPVKLWVKVPGYKSWQTQLDAAAVLAGDNGPLEVKLISQNLLVTLTDAETGQPVPAVAFLAQGQAQPQAFTADDQGHFEATRVEPPLTLRVEAPGYEPWQTKLTTLEGLLAGNPAYKLPVQLTPRVTAGLLRAADTGQPLAGLTLTTAGQTVTTDAAGRFELRRLRPDDRLTLAAPDGYLPVEVSFNNETELSLTLQPRQVVVTARDNFSGQPVAGVNVSFGPTLTAVTDAQGQATLTRAPAAGQVMAALSGYQPATATYKGETALAVTLTPSAIQGIVRASDTGQPLPQAALYFNDTILRADDNGHFTLDLPTAPGQLMIKSAGYHRAYGQLSQTGIITGYAPPFSGAEGRWLAVTPCAPAAPGLPCLEFVLEPFQARAIYVPFLYLSKRESIIRYLDFIQSTGELNAMVIDIKSDNGRIGWISQTPLAWEVRASQMGKDWMPLDEVVAEAHKRNIYIIARMVVFKDNPLTLGKPELAAKRADGTIWLDKESLGWANVFREETWDYNVALAKEAAAFGFDELNFDYIRFPSDGDVSAIVYKEENTLETRTTALREFIQRLTDALRPTGVFVSADVFGLTIWVKPDSDMKIGQRVMDIAPYIDYLAPMVYPSTFIPGNLGYKNPRAEPYGIVYRSQIQAVSRVPPYVKVRPWLQCYWYSVEEKLQLKQAAIDANSTGWTWWNAGGKYESELFGESKK